MKKKTIIIVVVVAVIVLLLLTLIKNGVKSYNNLVSLEESVNNKYAAISTQLQRRADLIPNLVSTVKGYVAYEEEIFTKIAEARQNLLSASNPKEAAAANEVLNQTLTQVLALSESYPELKGNTEFTQLMDELSGTENRIAVARKDYNDVTETYNKTIKQIPTVFFANMLGFETKEYFQADESANKVPNVSFE